MMRPGFLVPSPDGISPRRIARIVGRLCREDVRQVRMFDPDNEKLAAILDRSGDYRVLRRVPPLNSLPMSEANRAVAGLAVAVVLDTETTGLGPTDEILELAMAKVAFDPATARIVGLVDTFDARAQPSRPIPPDVVRLTGITDADVAGRHIDPDEVAAFVAGAAIVVAHNADFDRRVVERCWPVFVDLPWACSLTQVDWRAEGFDGRRLGQLLAECRFFHASHRALDDVLALVHLLRQPLTLGAPVFTVMMHEAAQVGVRIWAAHAPFHLKDVLKARGYRWSSGAAGPRAWYRDVLETAASAEIAFLRESIYDDVAFDPPRRRITALDRFSARVDAPDP